MYEPIIRDEWKDIDLDYTSENNFSSFFSSAGSIHSYPAKAVPEMINSLLLKLKQLYNIDSVLDPFVGSGTIALEAKYLGLDFYGSDLNPLAILLARTKVLTIKKTPYIKKRILEFIDDTLELYQNEKFIPIEHFDNIEFWFKEENIRELSYLKRRIDLFLSNSKKYRMELSLIMLTAFSSTIRNSSLSRNGEFKLYRISPSDIKRFQVNSLNIFKEKIEDLLNMLVSVSNSYNKETVSDIFLENAKNLNYLQDKKIDLIMTSPPYGDSQSTVAYGQFSRLSLQWMGDLLERYININCISENCDQYLLGGKKSQIEIHELDVFYKSDSLNQLIWEMDEVIQSEEKTNLEIKSLLYKLIEDMNGGNILFKNNMVVDSNLFELIKERVRLDIFRKIKYTKSNLTSKEIKLLSLKQRDLFFKELFSNKSKIRYRRSNQLKDKLPLIIQAIDRKIQAQPRRKQEVINFFKDLYQVVLETDKVLTDEGIQTWIVGHRTILGQLVVNMEGILKEWFQAMGYSVITSLQRKYSFKRMPHHINSTLSRKKQVQTMMNEYILIVKKNKS